MHYTRIDGPQTTDVDLRDVRALHADEVNPGSHRFTLELGGGVEVSFWLHGEQAGELRTLVRWVHDERHRRKPMVGDATDRRPHEDARWRWVHDGDKALSRNVPPPESPRDPPDGTHWLDATACGLIRDDGRHPSNLECVRAAVTRMRSDSIDPQRFPAVVVLFPSGRTVGVANRDDGRSGKYNTHEVIDGELVEKGAR